jgi:hypothetical protein
VLVLALCGASILGFPGLAGDLGDDLDIGAGALAGILAATVGVAVVATVLLRRWSATDDRRTALRRRGTILSLIGPVTAITLGFSARSDDPVVVTLLHAVGGGAATASALVAVTGLTVLRGVRPVVAAVVASTATWSITLLLGWRLAVELPAGGAVILFLVLSRRPRR